MKKYLVTAMLLLACSDARDPAAPPAFSLAQVSQEETPEQHAVAQLVPGFGGYFLDRATGRPTVYLTDGTQAPAAADALATFLSSRGFTAGDLVVRQANYDYLTLDAWYRSVWPDALAVDGAVFADLDEANNRLRFGAVDAGAVAAVQSVLAGEGIPAAALAVEIAAPIRELATLQEFRRPVTGALQITFFRTDQLDPVDASPLQSVCTLGFNAIHTGAASLITNSHCTNARSQEEGTEYYQHTRRVWNSDNPVNGPNTRFIAVEADDPPFFEGGDCPLLRECRFSDASRAAYIAGAEFELGRIARTTESYDFPPESGPVLTIDDLDPTFRIIGVRKNFVVGETLNKVGRTTGWTVGPVTATCATANVLGSRVTMLCQDFVEAGSDQGDSGSPVFVRRGPSNVQLAGILWGGSVDADPPFFVLSRYSLIERELGALTVN